MNNSTHKKIVKLFTYVINLNLTKIASLSFES